MEDDTTLPSLMCAMGGPEMVISDDQLRKTLHEFLHQLGPQDDVFLVPPDFTRYHSQAGKITEMIAEYYQIIPSQPTTTTKATTKATTTIATKVPTTTTTTTPPGKFQIMPALGTHAPMTMEQIKTMFGTALATKYEQDRSLFQVHDWRKDVVTIGHVPAEMVQTATRGMMNEPWPAQLNKAIWEKRNQPRSVVLSIGQGKQKRSIYWVAELQ
jgi:hypothetical protein